MTLRAAPPLKGSDIYAEFGAANGVNFSEFLLGGDYVSVGVTGGTIPAELPLHGSDFYGATAEPRISFQGAVASSGTLVVSQLPGGLNCGLSYTHPTGTSNSSASAQATISLTYKLGQVPSGSSLYLTCLAASLSGGVYYAFAEDTGMPNLAGGTPSSTPTSGSLTYVSDTATAHAELIARCTQLAAVSPIAQRKVGALLSVAPAVGDLITINLELSHFLSNPFVAAITHQGTSTLIIQPVFMFLSGGGTVIEQEAPFSIFLDTNGTLTVGV